MVINLTMSEKFEAQDRRTDYTAIFGKFCRTQLLIKTLCFE